MRHPPRLRAVRSAMRGLLILLCVFAVPKLASSEADTSMDLNAFLSKRSKVIHQGVGYPARLFLENNDCTVAKLDIWVQHGTVTHSASLPDGGLNFSSVVGPKGTTMLIGGKDCRIRVRIEAVPAGTSILE